MKNISSSNNDHSCHPNNLIGAKVYDKKGNKAHIQTVHPTDDGTIAVLKTEDGKIMNVDVSGFEMREGYFFSLVPLEERQVFLPQGLPNEMKIPVVEEQLSINIQKVDTGRGVRVKKEVLTHEQSIDVPHTEEILTTKYVKIDQIVSEHNVPQARQEGDTFIIPVLEEIYVLEKKILLKEEVRVTRRRKTTSEVQKINLRSEKVTVNRFDESVRLDNEKK